MESPTVNNGTQTIGFASANLVDHLQQKGAFAGDVVTWGDLCKTTTIPNPLGDDFVTGDFVFCSKAAPPAPPATPPTGPDTNLDATAPWKREEEYAYANHDAAWHWTLPAAFCHTGDPCTDSDGLECGYAGVIPGTWPSSPGGYPESGNVTTSKGLRVRTTISPRSGTARANGQPWPSLTFPTLPVIFQLDFTVARGVSSALSRARTRSGRRLAAPLPGRTGQETAPASPAGHHGGGEKPCDPLRSPRWR